MSFLRGRRQKLLAASGTIAGLVVVVAAVAYFTGADGSGSGNATVGSSTGWSVSVNAGGASYTDSGGATGCDALYPGACTEVIPFTVTNNGKGHQNLNSISYGIKADNSNPANAETASGTVLTGCLASWFAAAAHSSNGSTPVDLGPGGTYTGSADVTMSDQPTSQDSCQGKTPGITVTAKS